MEQLVDFDFLQELSGGDSKYIYELLDIFLATTPDGVIKLQQLINTTDDWEAIYKQAHFLKSSVGIVRIKDMHPQLARIEELGRKEHEGVGSKDARDEVRSVLDTVLQNFHQAHGILIRERDKHKQLAGVE